MPDEPIILEKLFSKDFGPFADRRRGNQFSDGYSSSKNRGATNHLPHLFFNSMFYNVYQFNITPALLVGFCVNVELVG